MTREEVERQMDSYPEGSVGRELRQDWLLMDTRLKISKEALENIASEGWHAKASMGAVANFDGAQNIARRALTEICSAPRPHTERTK